MFIRQVECFPLHHNPCSSCGAGSFLIPTPHQLQVGYGTKFAQLRFYYDFSWGFPDGSPGKESARNAGDTGDVGSIPGLGKSPWRRKWQPTPGFLPKKSHGQRSLVGYSPQGRKESDMTERLHFPFSLFSPENTFDRHTAGSSESISCRRGRSH